MSEKTASATAPAVLLPEDVTTPPPEYLERGTTTPTVVVQDDAPSVPAETEVVRGTSPSQEAPVGPTLVGEDEYVYHCSTENDLQQTAALYIQFHTVTNYLTRQHHTVTSPPPTYPPMLPAEAPKTPGQSTAGHVTALEYLTDQPTWIKCPYCNQRTKTQVTAEGSSAQWYVFDVLTTFLSPFPIPFPRSCL